MIGGRSRIWLASVLVGSTILAGCGGIGGKIERGAVNYENFTAEQIFGRAEFDLARGRNEQAATLFAEVERLYPFSEWAKRAVIMQAFAHHKDQSYENSRSAAQRFIDCLLYTSPSPRDS